MWFKNIQIYRLPACWNIGRGNILNQIARGPFAKCTANQPVSRGWISPNGNGSLLFSLGTSHWLVALKVQERLLPSSVVNEEVRERAEQIEAQQGYAPGRKQLRELKERVTEELMPRAFTRSRTTFAWIDPYDGWLCIDAGSQSKAEEVIEHLRYCLDELPIRLVNTEKSPAIAMAGWLASGEAPTGFTIDHDCDLEAYGEERAKVSYKRHSLDGDQIREHLASGKLPTKLALTWDDRISFVFTDKMEIRRLAFLDLLKDQGAENAEDKFEADFALMTGELSRFLPALIDALGGEYADLADQGLN